MIIVQVIIPPPSLHIRPSTSITLTDHHIYFLYNYLSNIIILFTNNFFCTKQKTKDKKGFLSQHKQLKSHDKQFKKNISHWRSYENLYASYFTFLINIL